MITFSVITFMFESQLIQMLGPGTSSFIGLAPGHFLLCKSPGTGHTFWCKSPGVPGGGGGITGQIDTCIIGMLTGNFSETPKNTPILILNT